MSQQQLLLRRSLPLSRSDSHLYVVYRPFLNVIQSSLFVCDLLTSAVCQLLTSAVCQLLTSLKLKLITSVVRDSLISVRRHSVPSVVRECQCM